LVIIITIAYDNIINKLGPQLISLITVFTVLCSWYDLRRVLSQSLVTAFRRNLNSTVAASLSIKQVNNVRWRDMTNTWLI